MQIFKTRILIQIKMVHYYLDELYANELKNLGLIL